MLEKDDGMVRAVAWSEIFPWLGIVRTFRIAISLRVLVFGTLGILLTLFGWAVLEPSFPATTGGRVVARTAVANVPGRPPCKRPLAAVGSSAQTAAQTPGHHPVFGTWTRLSLPGLSDLNAQRLRSPALACYVLATLWALAVWAFFGGAIGRIAVGPIGGRREGRLGGSPAVRRGEMALLFRRSVFL